MDQVMKNSSSEKQRIICVAPCADIQSSGLLVGNGSFELMIN